MSTKGRRGEPGLLAFDAHGYTTVYKADLSAECVTVLTVHQDQLKDGAVGLRVHGQVVYASEREAIHALWALLGDEVNRLQNLRLALWKEITA